MRGPARCPPSAARASARRGRRTSAMPIGSCKHRSISGNSAQLNRRIEIQRMAGVELSGMRGLAAILLLTIGLTTLNAESGEYFVYFGTYTATISKGIYAWRFQPPTGKLTEIGPVAEAPNPSFLAFSPDRRHLYVVNWKGSETVKGNTVSAYGVDGHTG